MGQGWNQVPGMGFRHHYNPRLGAPLEKERLIITDFKKLLLKILKIHSISLNIFSNRS